MPTTDVNLTSWSLITTHNTPRQQSNQSRTVHEGKKQQQKRKEMIVRWEDKETREYIESR